MRSRYWLLLVALVPLAASVFAQTAGKKLYRWTDANGTVHFSDHVPPEAVKEERDVLSPKSGSVKAVLPRQKTEEEMAEDARRAKAEQQQADYDKYLLKTYSTVADLEKVRDERLSGLDVRVQQAEKLVNDTQDAVAEMRSRAAGAQASGQPMDPDLQREIDAYDSTLTENRTSLAHIRQERQRAADQFARDIERYKQLQGGGVAAKPNG
jgi:hypothetical protein